MLGPTITKTAVIVTLGAASAILLFYVRNKLCKNRVPKKWKAVGKVTKLTIYPLKSGRGLPVQSANCTKFGLKELPKYNKAVQLQDRTFSVYRADTHEYGTARYYPKMVLVKMRADGMNSVRIEAPDMDPLFVVIPEEDKSKSTYVKLWRDEMIGIYDCGDEAAEWFSNFILKSNVGLRLGYFDSKFNRDIEKSFAKELKYYDKVSNAAKGILSDMVSMHLISAPSIMDLNSRLEGSYVSAENFRPTIVVDERDLKPYEEDEWDWIKIGDVILRNVSECPRCLLCTIDPDTGEKRTDGEPLKTLKKFRKSDGALHGPIMGRYLQVCQQGTLNVNDIVYVNK